MVSAIAISKNAVRIVTVPCLRFISARKQCQGFFTNRVGSPLASSAPFSSDSFFGCSEGPMGRLLVTMIWEAGSTSLILLKHELSNEWHQKGHFGRIKQGSTVLTFLLAFFSYGIKIQTQVCSKLAMVTSLRGRLLKDVNDLVMASGIYITFPAGLSSNIPGPLRLHLMLWGGR